MYVSRHCKQHLGAPQGVPQNCHGMHLTKKLVGSTVRMVDFDLELPEHIVKKQGGPQGFLCPRHSCKKLS